MKLAVHAFTQRQQRTPTTLQWKPDPVSMDPADEPSWAVWETECRTYRVVFSAKSDTYSPCCVQVTKVSRHAVERVWPECHADQYTLELAQEACEQHRRGDVDA